MCIRDRIWTPEEKLELISQVLAGKSNQEVALSAGINGGMLYQLSLIHILNTKLITIATTVANTMPCTENAPKDSLAPDRPIIMITEVMIKLEDLL